MSIDDLPAGCAAPPPARGGFDHVAHLRLALACLAESGSLEIATARMAAALREMAAAAGQPGKYHHTMTVFWMRMAARLLDKDLPLAYYSPERLWSDEARHGWLEPDRQPLDAAPSGPAHPPRHPSHRALSR